MTEYLILSLIGLFAGGVGGLLGVGGSIIMIPAMTEIFGPQQHLYQSAAMIVNFFVVVPAVIQHRRAGAVNKSTVARIMPLALVAVVLGVVASELPFFRGSGEAKLRGVFGLFLFCVASNEFCRLIRPIEEPAPLAANNPSISPRLSWRLAAAVALPVGFIAGLLGIGGGLVAVPLQQRLLKIPIRNAIANSAALIIATSIVGATSKNYAFMSSPTGNLKPLLYAAVLIPTAIIGSYVGAHLTHRVPMRTVKIGFFLLLATAAIRLCYTALRDMTGLA